MTKGQRDVKPYQKCLKFCTETKFGTRNSNMIISFDLDTFLINYAYNDDTLSHDCQTLSEMSEILYRD